MTFSMGAGDRQTLLPPVSDTLPVTGKSVAILFNQLGKLSSYQTNELIGKLLLYSDNILVIL